MFTQQILVTYVKTFEWFTNGKIQYFASTCKAGLALKFMKTTYH